MHSIGMHDRGNGRNCAHDPINKLLPARTRDHAGTNQDRKPRLSAYLRSPKRSISARYASTLRLFR